MISDGVIEENEESIFSSQFCKFPIRPEIEGISFYIGGGSVTSSDDFVPIKGDIFKVGG
ncbi:polymorphic outer membrane G family /autotransporter domain protein [Chlamydia psittaci CP3]|nr:polymorphic outer membrane G family /autotransporter domain protein [Chlamydia psittaci CP3]